MELVGQLQPQEHPQLPLRKPADLQAVEQIERRVLVVDCPDELWLCEALERPPKLARLSGRPTASHRLLVN